MSAQEPDTQLVREAMAGSAAAFTTLCERHRARVWRVAASMARGTDADDLAQEAIVRAWCARRAYRAEASFEAWLCRIALHAARDYQRSAWKRRVVLLDLPPVEPEHESPEGAAERREMQRLVRQAVSLLPERQSVPIWLHYFEEFSLAEVARLERASESTIRSRIQAGLRRLSRCLGDLAPRAADNPARLETDAKGCEV